MKAVAAAVLIPLLVCGGSLSNRRAPSFTLPDAKLVYHDILDYRGKVLIIDFMQTTCPHCATLSGTLEKIKAKYGEKLAILSIVNPPDTTATMAQYSAKHKISTPLLFDYGLTTAAYLKITPQNSSVSVPHLFVIDAQGMIREDFAYAGADKAIFEGSGLVPIIDKLLKGSR